MEPISITVYGEAQPAGSKRGFNVGGHVQIVDANPKSREWKNHVAAEAAKIYKGPILDGPIELRMVFYRVRPKSHYGTGRNAGVMKNGAPEYPAMKPDATKLARGAEDSMTGIVYRDDCQVVDLHVHKRYGEPARVEIEVLESKPQIVIPEGSELSSSEPKKTAPEEPLASGDKLPTHGTLFETPEAQS